MIRGTNGVASRLVTLGAAVIFFTAPAGAGTAEDFEAANRAYAGGDYAGARRGYERVIEYGWHANALYNLGNTFFRLGDPGRAILEYERVLALRPRHPDATANLKLAREKSGAQLPGEPWWRRGLLWLTPGTAAALATGGCWFFLFAGGSLAWRRRFGIGFIGCGIGALAAAAYAAGVLWALREREQLAIVLVARTEARSEPAERASAADILPAGSRVRVLGEHGGWTYCRLPNGGRGWLPSSSIEFLVPRTELATVPDVITSKSAGFSGKALPLALATVMATSGGLRGEDWRSSVSKEPGSFRPLRPVKVHYEFGWSGFTAADADVSIGTNGNDENVLLLSAKTTGLVRTLWKLDAQASSVCKRTTLRPVQLSQTEVYKKKSIITKVDFTAEGPAQLRSLNPPDPVPPQVKLFKYPDSYDLFSALLFIRSRPLLRGESVRLCVYPGSAPYLATATVLGREKIKVAKRYWDAIKCDLKLNGVEDNFALKPHAKFKKAFAWISDDNDRLLLKVQAEVFVGSIWAEMQSVEFPEKK
jgi:hypothetical protein